MPRKARKNAPTDWSRWAVAARAATGLSQTEFGARLGKSKGAVTDWERAENGLDIRSVAKILETFGGVAPPPPLRLPSDPEARSRSQGAEESAATNSATRRPADLPATVPPAHAGGGYRVKTDQGEYIGRQLDGIESDELRAEAMEACSRAIREILHPSKLGAGRSPGRAQRR